MSTFSYLAVAAAVFVSGACNHENDRPLTPANGTTPASTPATPSVEPSVNDTPTQTPSTPPPPQDNDSRGTAMPGTRGTNDRSPLAPHRPSEVPNGTGTPTEGPNGAPVGGIH